MVGRADPRGWKVDESGVASVAVAAAHAGWEQQSEAGVAGVASMPLPSVLREQPVPELVLLGQGRLRLGRTAAACGRRWRRQLSQDFAHARAIPRRFQRTVALQLRPAARGEPSGLAFGPELDILAPPRT